MGFQLEFPAACVGRYPGRLRIQFVLGLGSGDSERRRGGVPCAADMSTDEPDLFAAQPAPKCPCARCGMGLAEKDKHPEEECQAQAKFRDYARATMSRVSWDD